MWKTLSTCFGVMALASIIAFEIARSVVHRRRKRERGIGGTQDIAMYGAFVTGLSVIGAVVCLIGWMVTK